MDVRPGELAERVREALLHAAVEAYEDAGLRGLCAEGRWEAAVGALRTLDLGAATHLGEEPPAAPGSSRGARGSPPAATRTDPSRGPEVGGVDPEAPPASPGWPPRDESQSDVEQESR